MTSKLNFFFLLRRWFCIIYFK